MPKTMVTGVKSRLLPALLLLLLFALPTRAAVSTYTWTGSAGGLFGFDYPGNWVGGQAPPTSPPVGTDIALVFSSSHSSDIIFDDSSFEFYSFTFNGSYPAYHFMGSDTSIDLGAGGITVGAGTNVIRFSELSLNLLSSQTWNIAGNLVIDGSSYLSSDDALTLTKSGTGTLTLGGGDGSGHFSFTGSLDVTAGTLLLANSSVFDGFIFGPAGSATITLRNGARLASTADLSIHNSVVVESGAIFGNASDRHSLSLLGTITLQSPATTLTLGSGTLTQFLGPIVQPGVTATSLTFTGPGLAVLAGANTYTGGTTANGAGILFGATAAVPSTGLISATNNGYIGSVAPSVLTAVLARINSNPANVTSFTGSLGLDTASTAETISNYSAPIDLTGFSPTNFKGLGSVSSARVTGSISTVGGGDYKFGGGTGTLYVESGLVASASAGLTLTAPLPLEYDRRFTLVLSGTNTFTGPINASGANLIFDGGSALPSGPTITLGAYGYVGYTEMPDISFATFLGRIAASPAATGVIGIDSHLVSEPRTLNATINLGGFSSVYLGSATKAIIDPSATIIAPSSGTVSLAGVNDGYFKVQAPLLTTNGINNVTVGLASNSPYATYSGTVELDSASSNYAGGTTLASGYLILGANSIRDGSILFGPIGIGSLVVPAVSHQPVLGSTANVTLHNSISLLGAGLVVGGDNVPGGNGTHNITLSGTISGSGLLDFRGTDATYTLNGNNPSFTGGISVADFTTVIAASDNALGTGMVTLASNGFLQLTSPTPVIGGSGGGGISGSGTVYVQGGSLVINQQREATFSGGISGESITVTKTGTATLHLSGESHYNGTTNINQGTVVMEGGSPFGSSTISLGGGTLQLASAQTDFTNPITFSAPSRLTGNGIISSPVTIGTNATLAPGQSPGFMLFNSGLTFASGGVFEVDIQGISNSSISTLPGVTNDVLIVTGDLAFSTPTTPFRLDLISLSTSGAAGNVADFSSSTAYTWPLALVQGNITGFTGTNVTINIAGFTNALNGGFFSLNTTNLGAGLNSLTLNFTPVPEPSTWALLAAGLGIVAQTIVRRKRR